MSRSFVVCAPSGGKRHTVRTTAETTFLKVLEEACQKFSLKPDQHVLKQGRTVVDLTKLVRLTNIPNNAKLDLVQEVRGASSADAEVNVALQLPDGRRIKGRFASGSCLWDILSDFNEKEGTPGTTYTGYETPGEADGAYMQAVCRYLRQEFDTNRALRATTLRDLGVTSGSAALQLLFKRLAAVPVEEPEPEPEVAQEMAVDPKDAVERDAAMAEESEGQASASADTAHVSVVAAEVAPPLASTAAPVQVSTGSSVVPMDVSPPVSSVVATGSDAARSLSDPSQPKKRGKQEDAAQATHPITATPPAALPSPSPLDMYPGLRPMLATPWSFDEAKEASAKPARPPAERQPEISRHYIPANRYIPGQGPEFVDFSNFKFPDPPAKAKKEDSSESTAISASSSSAVSRAASHRGPKTEPEPKAAPLPPLPREALVYTLEGASEASANEVVPDDFFELTLQDLQTVLRDVQKVNDTERNLETQAMRDKRLKEIEEKYKVAVVRVYFPNRMVVQGRFWAKETIGDVRAFVASFLEDSSLAFYLYTSPPKTVYEDLTQTLQQARLAPYANVRFGSAASDQVLKVAHVENVASYEQAMTKMRALKAEQAKEQEGKEGHSHSHASTSSSAAASGAAASSDRSEAARSKLLKHLGRK